MNRTWQDIKSYLSGDRKGKDAHRVERLAQDDPFLQDALEGLDTLSTDQIEQDLHQIKQQTRRPKTSYIYYATAASIFLVVIIGLMLWSQRQEKVPQLAQQDNLPSEQMQDLLIDEDEEQIADKQTESNKKQEPINRPAKPKDMAEPIEDAFLMTADSEKTEERLVMAKIEDSEDQQLNVAVGATPVHDAPASMAMSGAPSPIRSKAAEAQRAIPNLATILTVTDPAGYPLPGVTVANVNGLPFGQTDIRGKAEIPESSEEIKLTLAGFEPQLVPISPQEKKTVTLTWQLTQASIDVLGAKSDHSDKEDFKTALKVLHRYLQSEIDSSLSGTTIVWLKFDAHFSIDEIIFIQSDDARLDQQLIELLQRYPDWSSFATAIPMHDRQTRIKITF